MAENGTTLERLQVVIEAYTAPYKKQMEQVKKYTKDAMSDVEKETAKIKRALEKVKQVTQNTKVSNSSDNDNKQNKQNNQNQGVEQWKNAMFLVKSSLQDLGNGTLIREVNEQMREYAKMANLASGTTIHTDSWNQLNNEIETAENNLEKLRKQQDALGESGKFEKSQEYKELSKCIEQTEKQLNHLLEKEDMMKEDGTSKNSKGWKHLQSKIEETRNTLKAYQADITNIKETGEDTAYSKKWTTLQQKIQQTQEQLSKYNQQKAMMTASGADVQFAKPNLWSNGSSIQTGTNIAKMEISQLSGTVNRVRGNVMQFIQTIPGIGGAIKNTAYVGSKAFNGLKSVFHTVSAGIKKTSGVFGALIQKFKQGIPHLNKTKSSMHGIGKTGGVLTGILRSIAMTAKFMFTSFLLYGVFNGVKQGFKNLTQYSRNVNNNLSMLMSSLTQLKNSFATAFAPVLNVVAPILNGFIQHIISAITAIGQFFAALTGQKTFTIAKKVHQDYAKSLNKTGDAAKKNAEKAKEAEGELMGFDRINNMNANKDNGSDGGGGAGGLPPGDMFDTVEIDSKYKDLADKVRGYFNQIFEPIQKAWDTYGKSVMDAWNYALSSVWSLIKSIGKSFLEVWTNGTGEEFCGNILKSLRLIFNMIGDIATAFKKAWDDKGRGTKFIQSIFDALNAVLDLLLEIGESMRTVWNSGSGESIIASLLEGFTHINNSIKHIADNFKKAWKLDNTGTKILQDLTDIIDNLLQHINNITKDFEKWTKGLDFSLLLKAFQGVTEALKPLGDKVGAGLEWLFKNVLQPLAKWAIEQAIPAALDAIKGALKHLNAIIKLLKPVGTWLWEKFLKPLGKWKGDIVVKALKTIGQCFDDLANIIEDASDWKEALVNIGKYLIEGLKNGIKIAISSIGNWIKKYLVEPIVKKVKTFFGIRSPSTVFKEIGKYLIDGLVQGIKSAPNAMLNALKGIWNNAKEWWNNNVKLPKLDMPEMGEIKTTFIAIKDKSFDIVSDAIIKIKENFKDKKAKFTATTNTAFNKVKDAVNDIRHSFKDKTANFNLKVKGKLEELKETISAFKNKTATFKAKIDDGVKYVRDTILNIKKYFVDKTAKYNAKVGSGFSKVKDAILDVKENFTDKTATFKAVVDKTFDKVKATVDDIKQYFVDRTAKYKAELVGKWETLKKTVVNIKDNFKSKTASFKVAVVTAWSTINERWKKLSGAFKDKKAEFSITMKTVVGSVRNFVNSIIDAVNNKLIAKLDFSFKAPSWLGGSTWGWKAPRIKRFADGGFPDTGQMFIAREAGPELVGSIGGRTAVANNDQIVTAVAQGVASAVNAVLVPAIQNGQHVNVALYGDAKNLFRMVQQENRSTKIRTGRYGLTT